MPECWTIKYPEITKTFSYLDVDQLIAMLEYKRPAFSKSEKEFISRFIDSVPGIQEDRFGNRWLMLGQPYHALHSPY